MQVEPTQRARHATELASLKGSFQSYEGLIVVGGDGLINEVQNGNLAGRKLPIAVVPAGGGWSGGKSPDTNLLSLLPQAPTTPWP